VFLRHLEYYQGVLFLTTNRVTTIDPAFESRIHLKLHYPDLDITARKSIWKTCLRSTKQPSNLEDDELDALAQHSLNGRQIKNVVKAGWLLANRYKRSVNANDLATALRITLGQSIETERTKEHIKQEN
jgi:SpoVK/Ycf46/Vps4 family AAA+-type ATPase